MLQYRPIPAAGCSNPLLYYWSAFLFLSNGHRTVAEAYKKVGSHVPRSCSHSSRQIVQHKNGRGVFKVPEPAGWHILIASPALVSEFLESKEADLSFFEGLADVCVYICLTIT